MKGFFAVCISSHESMNLNEHVVMYTQDKHVGIH